MKVNECIVCGNCNKFIRKIVVPREYRKVPRGWRMLESAVKVLRDGTATPHWRKNSPVREK